MSALPLTAARKRTVRGFRVAPANGHLSTLSRCRLSIGSGPTSTGLLAIRSCHPRPRRCSAKPHLTAFPYSDNYHYNCNRHNYHRLDRVMGGPGISTRFEPSGNGGKSLPPRRDVPTLLDLRRPLYLS